MLLNNLHLKAWANCIQGANSYQKTDVYTTYYNESIEF